MLRTAIYADGARSIVDTLRMVGEKFCPLKKCVIDRRFIYFDIKK